MKPCHLALKRKDQTSDGTTIGHTALLDPARMLRRMGLDDGTSQRLTTLEAMGVSINSLRSVTHNIEAARLVGVLPEWRLRDQSTGHRDADGQANSLISRHRSQPKRVVIKEVTLAVSLEHLLVVAQ
jgi:hypothetical protein